MKRLLFCFFLFFIFAPFPSHATTFGVSPPVFVSEAVRGSKVEGEFHILRGNPKIDEYLTVSKQDDPLDAVILRSGNRLFLPLGEERVTYFFSVDTSRLGSVDEYEASIRLTSEEGQIQQDGNTILLGITPKIKLSLIDTASVQDPIQYGLGDSQNEITIRDLVVDDEEAKYPQFSFVIDNNSDKTIAEIPYQTKTTSASVSASASSGFGDLILPNESGIVVIQGSEITKPGKYQFEVWVGDQYLQAEFYHDIRGYIRIQFEKASLYIALGLGIIFVLVGIWFFVNPGKRARIDSLSRWSIIIIFASAIVMLTFMCRQILHSYIDQFTEVSATGILLDKGRMFLVTDGETGSDFLVNTHIGESQVFEGKWRYFSTGRERVFAFPDGGKERQEYEDRFFLLDELGITAFDVSILPGAVDAVEENTRGKYAVFSGEREDGGGRYYCLAEIGSSSSNQCEFLEDVVKGEILSVELSESENNIVVINTTGKSFAYDFWRKTTSTSEDEGSGKILLREIPSVFKNTPVRSFFGIVILEGSIYFDRGAVAYYEFTPGKYYQMVETKKGQDVYIIDLESHKKMFLYSIEPSQSVYWLENGGFITSP
jgi:hypothetical protein